MLVFMKRKDPKRKRAAIAVLLFLLPAGCLYAQDLASLQKQAPVRINGNLSVSMDTYSALSGGNPGILNPFSWSVVGTPVVSIYGIAMPVSILISNQSKAYHLPFSRFGLSPYYKWAKLQLGWRSLDFSPFTLGGQNIFGAGVSLSPGQWHADFMYGKFNNAVTDISLFNNLNNSNTPVYSRKGYALQLGYGNEKNNFYISYLRARDDSASVGQDIKTQSQARPAANQVLGIRSRLRLLDHLSFYIDAAASHYMNDQGAGDTATTSNPWWQKLVSQPNSSSRLLTAFESGLQYNLPAFGLDLKYHRVDPGYQSMGAFYMQTDVEQYTIGPSFRILQNKLFFTGSLGLQRDNLFSKSAASSHRTIGLASISCNPSQVFGIDLQYSNFGISQQVLTQYVSPNPNHPLYDSVRISQVSQSITLSPHVLLANASTVNSISATFSYQNLSDRNPVSSPSGNFNSSIAVLTHSISFLQRKWQFSQSLTWLDTKLATGNTGNIGYTMGASKSIEKKKLAINGNLGYYRNLLAGASVGSTFNISAGAGIRIGKHQSIQGGAGMIDNNTKSSNGSPGNHFTQLTTYIRYNFSF